MLVKMVKNSKFILSTHVKYSKFINVTKQFLVNLLKSNNNVTTSFGFYNKTALRDINILRYQ